MSDQIQFNEEEDATPFFEFVRVKKVRVVHNLDQIAEAFSKELKTIALEELLQIDASIKMVMQMIQKLRPNMVVVNNGTTFICADTEVHIGECIAIRNSKMIATGTYEQIQEAICIKIQKEWPSKFDNLSWDEIDEDWLKKFCKMHYNKESLFKIIKT